MGFYPNTEVFLPCALEFVSQRRGGVIHYHHLCTKSEFSMKAVKQLEEVLVCNLGISKSLLSSNRENFFQMEEFGVVKSTLLQSIFLHTNKSKAGHPKVINGKKLLPAFTLEDEQWNKDVSLVRGKIEASNGWVKSTFTALSRSLCENEEQMNCILWIVFVGPLEGTWLRIIMPPYNCQFYWVLASHVSHFSLD